ncbi:MAG: glycosyltransferase [Eubacteriales bacterium]|nr:glycosyltransferase [Eubacteriales bacterium]
MKKYSVIILTHNSSEYVKITLESLQISSNRQEMSIIVWDNASDEETKDVIYQCYKKGYCEHVVFYGENVLFAKGNNMASKLADIDSQYIVLLNSDVEIRNPDWLVKLSAQHKKGISSYGLCVTAELAIVADGYCMLVDKELFDRYGLDEDYAWWGGLSRLEAGVLSQGYSVIAIKEHDDLIYHFGGKSGDGWKNAKGMDDKTIWKRRLGQYDNSVIVKKNVDNRVGSDYHNMLKIYGIYDDNWCGKTIKFHIQTGEKGKLVMDLWSPEIENCGDVTSDIIIGDFKISKTIQNGLFSWEFDVDKNSLIRVEICNHYFFEPGNGDIRELSFIIRDIKAE